MNHRPTVLLALLLVAGPSCGGPPKTAPAPRSAAVRNGGTPASPDDLAGPAVKRTVYVPVYSHIYMTDAAHPFDLAVTLSVRNTDRSAPLVLTAVRYHDSDGKLLRDELTAPVKIAPLAAAEFFIKESDRAGGSAACFLVDWQAPGPLSEPVVEAVMVGTAMNQGISFTSPGRTVTPPQADAR